MARYYKMFTSAEERKQWEEKQKREHSDFKVCMHMTAKQLAEDLYMHQAQVFPYKVATVYRYTEEN